MAAAAAAAAAAATAIVCRLNRQPTPGRTVCLPSASCIEVRATQPPPLPLLLLQLSASDLNICTCLLAPLVNSRQRLGYRSHRLLLKVHFLRLRHLWFENDCNTLSQSLEFISHLLAYFVAPTSSISLPKLFTRLMIYLMRPSPSINNAESKCGSNYRNTEKKDGRDAGRRETKGTQINTVRRRRWKGRKESAFSSFPLSLAGKMILAPRRRSKKDKSGRGRQPRVLHRLGLCPPSQPLLPSFPTARPLSPESCGLRGLERPRKSM